VPSYFFASRDVIEIPNLTASASLLIVFEPVITPALTTRSCPVHLHFTMAFRVSKGSSRAQKIFHSRSFSNPAGLGTRNSAFLAVPCARNPNPLIAKVPASASETSFRDAALDPPALSNVRRRSSVGHSSTSAHWHLGRKKYSDTGTWQAHKPRVVSDSISCYREGNALSSVHINDDFACSGKVIAEQSIRTAYTSPHHDASGCMDPGGTSTPKAATKCTHVINVSFTFTRTQLGINSLHATDLPQLHAHAELPGHVHQFRHCAANPPISEPTPVAAYARDSGKGAIALPIDD
jgi:hypothetical protein